MYYVIDVSVPSLYRESTDRLIEKKHSPAREVLERKWHAQHYVGKTYSHVDSFKEVVPYDHYLFMSLFTTIIITIKYAWNAILTTRVGT